MKPFFWILLFLTTVAHASDTTFDNTLSVKAARYNLKAVMRAIAQDIGKEHKNFVQLKKWKRAEISDNQIRYQYQRKNINCDLTIYSKNTIELASATSTLPNELKVGIYLKMNASGERAEELKEFIRGVVAKHFEAIRRLKKELH